MDDRQPSSRPALRHCSRNMVTTAPHHLLSTTTPATPHRATRAQPPPTPSPFNTRAESGQTSQTRDLTVPAPAWMTERVLANDERQQCGEEGAEHLGGVHLRLDLCGYRGSFGAPLWCPAGGVAVGCHE